MAERVVIHLKTQRDQPYGSERRCCEICGVMLWGQPNEPHWTSDPGLYYGSDERCSEVSSHDD